MRDFIARIQPISFNGIKTDGKTSVVLPKATGYICPYYEGLASVSNRDLDPESKSYRFGFIDKSGRWVLKPQFDNMISTFECGLARVNVGEHIGYIDKYGEFIWNPRR